MRSIDSLLLELKERIRELQMENEQLKKKLKIVWEKYSLKEVENA